MKISKEEALKTIRDVQLTEYLLYTSDVFNAMTHLRACDLLQHIERLVEKSTLSEFEDEE